MYEKNMLDFWNCDYKFLYNKFMFKINDFAINSEDHNCVNENIYNDWITIFFDKEIDIEKYKIKDIYNIEYNSDDKILIINDDNYKVDADEFHYFISDFYADFNQSVNNIMNHFCEWFMKNINDF